MTWNNQFLNDMRNVSDEYADDIVNLLFEAGRQNELYETISRTEGISTSPDSSILSKFSQGNSTPDWHSDERILSGQKVFEKYASEIMTLLGVLSLPYLYAGSPGNKALYLSEKMRNSPGKRLLDTAEFVISVSTPGSLSDPSSSGHQFIKKIRLVHSIARFHVGNSSSWDKNWGVPINQEDMAGTNLGFSYVILNGLRKSGHSLTEQQKEDFLFLWRYIGFQNGIREELLPKSYKESFHLTSLIKRRNFKKSVEGEELTKELIKYYRSVMPDKQSAFIESQLKYYLGSRISEYIGLKPDPIKDGIAELVNSFKELQNSFSNHENSYGEMIRQIRQMKDKSLL